MPPHEDTWKKPTTYGSIEDSNKDEKSPLVPSSNNNNDNDKLDSKQGNCNMALLIGVPLLLLVTAAGWAVWKKEQTYGGSTFTPPLDPPSSIVKIKAEASPEDEHFLGGYPGIERAHGADPSPVWGKVEGPYPTNAWYLNLVSHKASVQPDDASRVYTVPYIIDTAANVVDMAGIRVHWPVMQANSRNVQMVNDFKNGITLGTLVSNFSHYVVDEDEPLSPLGVSLKWNLDKHDNDDDKSSSKMTSHIVRGMPYATLHFHGEKASPSLHSYNALASTPLIDNGKGDVLLECGVMDSDKEEGSLVSVQKEIQLHFVNSDFTWALFFSEPVQVRCEQSEGDIALAQFRLHVVKNEESRDNSEEQDPLTVRLALLDQCTTGHSNVQQHCQEKAAWNDSEGYVKLLRERSGVFPSSPEVAFDYSHKEGGTGPKQFKIGIDWKPRHTTTTSSGTGNLRKLAQETPLLMFALPHHYESNTESDVAEGDDDQKATLTEYCIPSFHGKTCLVEGNKWSLVEDVVMSDKSQFASRPPEASSIPALAKALNHDIHYELQDNLLRGAGDTYFPGKILGRMGRVLMILTELKLLADSKEDVESLLELYDDKTLTKSEVTESVNAASSASLPSQKDIDKAVSILRKGVEIWLDPTRPQAALFVFDRSWGGLVNCGCNYTAKDSHGYCRNVFPDCPALDSVNQDFGNGFYNDHHYHYGYFVYSAAVVAKHDPEWGRRNFDKVLLLIRDFANPSDTDEYFPQYRQKDWFLGSSWASGIVSAENSPHGRDQESSSEAIAAYEGVGLFGAVMVEAFAGDEDNVAIAKSIRDAGQLLASTEVRATNRYWHVWPRTEDDDTKDDHHMHTYPAAYDKPVVGMLYDTMASFQTWFAPWAVVSYGIQLMPLTAIADYRDDPEWAQLLYPLYEESCETAGDFCVDNGWSILQAGLLATAGEREKALKQAMAIPSKVFASEGGMGNSLSNTIWYIATRKPVDTR